jgi:hypothetical protein
MCHDYPWQPGTIDLMEYLYITTRLFESHLEGGGVNRLALILILQTLN